MTAEIGYLMPFPHLHGEGDGPAPPPFAVGIPACIEVEEADGVLITPGNRQQVPEIHGGPGIGGGEEDVADLSFVLELSGGIDGDVPTGDLHHAPLAGDVSRPQDVPDIHRIYPVSGQALLGVLQIDLFLLHPHPVHLGHIGYRLQGPDDEIRHVVELAEAVLVAGPLPEHHRHVFNLPDYPHFPNVGVKLRQLHMFLQIIVDIGHQCRVVQRRFAVQTEVSRRLDDLCLLHDPVFLDGPDEDPERGEERLGIDGEGKNGGQRRPGGRGADSGRRSGRAGGCYGLADRIRPDGQFGFVGLGAGHGEHQGGGIGIILDEIDRTGVVRKVPDAIQPQLDIVEFLGRFLKIVQQFQMYNSHARSGDGVDAFDLGVFRNLFLNPPGQELFDLFRPRPRPGTEDHGHAAGDVGVLALGHLQIAIDPPEDNGKKQYPGDMAVLNEKPRGIFGFFDVVLVRAVLHEPPAPGPGSRKYEQISLYG